MNQKEEIQKQERRLASLESELQLAKEEFKKRYSDIKKRVTELDKEWARLYNKQNRIKERVAGVISDSPMLFSGGQSSSLKEDIREFGKSLDINYVEWGHDYQNVVWNKYNKLFETVPEFKEISDREDVVSREASNLKEITPGYLDLEKKINDLENDIVFVQRFIKELGDISYFRQHAKEMKKRDEEEQKRKTSDEQIKVFTDWFDKNYIPKMRQVIIAASKD